MILQQFAFTTKLLQMYYQTPKYPGICLQFIIHFLYDQEMPYDMLLNPLITTKLLNILICQQFHLYPNRFPTITN